MATQTNSWFILATLQWSAPICMTKKKDKALHSEFLHNYLLVYVKVFKERSEMFGQLPLAAGVLLGAALMCRHANITGHTAIGSCDLNRLSWVGSFGDFPFATLSVPWHRFALNCWWTFSRQHLHKVRTCTLCSQPIFCFLKCQCPGPVKIADLRKMLNQLRKKCIRWTSCPLSFSWFWWAVSFLSQRERVWCYMMLQTIWLDGRSIICSWNVLLFNFAGVEIGLCRLWPQSFLVPAPMTCRVCPKRGYTMVYPKTTKIGDLKFKLHFISFISCYGNFDRTNDSRTRSHRFFWGCTQDCWTKPHAEQSVRPPCGRHRPTMISNRWHSQLVDRMGGVAPMTPGSRPHRSDSKWGSHFEPEEFFWWMNMI